jgi:hypothetical protein
VAKVWGLQTTRGFKRRSGRQFLAAVGGSGVNVIMESYPIDFCQFHYNFACSPQLFSDTGECCFCP